MCVGYVGYVVNKSDLTDKRDLTVLSLVGQEKSFLGKSARLWTEKLGAKKPPQIATAVCFYRIMIDAMASKRPRVINAALKSMNSILMQRVIDVKDVLRPARATRPANASALVCFACYAAMLPAHC